MLRDFNNNLALGKDPKKETPKLVFLGVRVNLLYII
jgi:hypothetical protein